MTSQKVAVVIMVEKYYRSVKQLLIVSRRGGGIVLTMEADSKLKVEFVSKLLLKGPVRK